MTESRSDEASPSVQIMVPKDESESSRSRFWRVLCLLFFLGTLFQSFKPSTPFMSPYLKYRHEMSGSDISNNYYPYRTFSMFVLMVPITILAEFYFGYMPVLFAGIVARVSEQFMLYYCQPKDYSMIRLSQILHGMASCTKTVHGAILYLIAPQEFFPVMTGLLRTSNLTGQVFEGITSNLIFDYWADPEKEFFILFTITQITVTTGGIFMVILFIIIAYDKKCATNKDSNRPLAPKITSLTMLRDLVRKVYWETPGVLLWSFWWWTAYSVGELVDEMHTALIEDRLGKGGKNGFLSATIGATSALCAFLTGRSERIVKKYSTFIVIGCLALSGTLLLTVSHLGPGHDYFFYACIVTTLFLSEGSAVAANSIISVALPKSLRGLTLFFNTFLQLMFQSTVQIVPQTFSWSVSTKFKILGVILYIVCLVIFFGTQRSDNRIQGKPDPDQISVANDESRYSPAVSSSTHVMGTIKSPA